MNLDEARASVTPPKEPLMSVTLERGIVGWALYTSGNPAQANFNSFMEAIDWLHKTFTVDGIDEPTANVEPEPDPLARHSDLRDLINHD